MFLFLLASIIGRAYGVCFESATSSVPRLPVEVTTPSTLAKCKLQCIRKATCESAYFKEADLTCTLLGQEIQGQCIAPYTRGVKKFANCPKTDPTPDYVTDPCFASASLSPDKIKLESSPVCPNGAVDGEATARVYVISVIYADGTYGVYDNDGSAKIYWNATMGSYAYYYFHQGKQYFDDPLYAATCVYYPAGATNDCACAPLPQDPGASGRTGAFIIAKHGIWRGCGPCTKFKLQCMNKLWILSQPDEFTPNIINSFALGKGTCYQP